MCKALPIRTTGDERFVITSDQVLLGILINALSGQPEISGRILEDRTGSQRQVYVHPAMAAAEPLGCGGTITRPGPAGQQLVVFCSFTSLSVVRPRAVAVPAYAPLFSPHRAVTLSLCASPPISRAAKDWRAKPPNAPRVLAPCWLRASASARRAALIAAGLFGYPAQPVFSSLRCLASVRPVSPPPAAPSIARWRLPAAANAPRAFPPSRDAFLRAQTLPPACLAISLRARPRGPSRRFFGLPHSACSLLLICNWAGQKASLIPSPGPRN